MMKKLFIFLFAFLVCCISQNNADAQSPTSRKLNQHTSVSNSKKAVKKFKNKEEKLKADGMWVEKKTTASVSPDEVFITNMLVGNAGNSFSSEKNEKNERCNTSQALENRLQNDAQYQKYRSGVIEKFSNYSLENAKIACDPSNSVIIPVAIHFDNAYNTSNIACIEAAIDAQIASLNADFAAENADITKYSDILTNCAPNEPCVASDGACITFCVADQDHPAGYGLNDGDLAYTIGQFNGGGFGAGGSGAGADWAGYLNMFVMDGLGFGVADGIPGAVNGDGVSQDGAFFGGPGFAPCSSGGTLNDDAFWNLGRTMTHEVGHYLGLYHTFQDGCSDEPQTPFPVTDTPAQTTSSSGCPDITNCNGFATGCTAGQFTQANFMDYFDDACLVMFSQEQVAAMNTFASSANWKTSAVSCSFPATNPIAACSLRAAFDPADGTPITICTDDGTGIQFTDASSATATTFNWTFSVAGTATVDVANSTMQSPMINVTSGDGTSGTLTVTLVACEADGVTCETTTNTYPLTVVSGVNCPNECDYTLNITDTFGDSWDGASLEILQDGVSLGSFTTAGAGDTYTLTLTDGSAIDVVYTSGAFENEHLYDIVDPFGNTIFSDGPNPTTGTAFSFAAACSLPTCSDGIQNGDETGVDCGGTTCGDCCSNGVQDADESGVDCGGADCNPCPTCAVGETESINETFDGCALPVGWTTSNTDAAANTVGTCDDDVSGFSFDCTTGFSESTGAGPSAGFSGCQAVFNDDNVGNGQVGIGCIISPVIDLTGCASATFGFDWQSEDAGGGAIFSAEVFDGTAWQQVFTNVGDGNGSESIDVSAFANGAFQVQFCYDDNGSWEWGMAIDNVALCTSCTVACPASVDSPFADALAACDDSGAISLPTSAADLAAGGLALDNSSDATYSWSTGGYLSAGGTAVADPANVAAISTAACTVTSETYYLNVDCGSAPLAATLDGGTYIITVYPGPPADLSTLVMISGENSCNEPSVMPITGCESFVTVAADAGNPAFPVAAGMSGTATYDITYTSDPAGPECCPTVGGATTELVADGSFEAGPGGGAWTEASTNFGTPLCDEAGCGLGTGTGPSDGLVWAWFGGIGASEIASVSQSITVPAAATSLTLTFDLEMIICDSPSDFLNVSVGGTQVFTIDGSAAICGTLGYSTQTIDLLAAGVAPGSTVTISFESEIFAVNGEGTNFFVDNVSVIAEEAAGADLCAAQVTADYDCVAGCNASAAVIATIDPTTICVDGTPDPINVTITGGTGTGTWVVTDAAGIILDLPANGPFDFDGAGGGVCVIWYVNFDDPAFTPAVGDDAAAAVAASSCAFLSNPISVTRNEVLPSVISTDVTTVCAGDPNDEINVNIDTPGTGTQTQFVITDATGSTILGTPAGNPVSLSGAPAGQCIIWVVDHDGSLNAPTDQVADLEGCFALSNGVTIDRIEVLPSVISTDVTTVCAGDPNDEINVNIDTPGTGTQTQFVITDATGSTILGTPAGNPVSLAGAPLGQCIIWVVDHDGSLNAPTDQVTDLEGCFALSNGITIDRIDCTVTGEVTGDSTDPCNCGNANNIMLNAGDDPTDPLLPVEYFYDFITISTTPATTGLAISTMNETGILDMNGDPATLSFTDNGDGTYTAEFYHEVGTGFSVMNITGSDGAGITVSFGDEAGSCSQCATEDIPTLSEWGLITLALMLMTYGTIAMAGVGTFAGTNNINTPVGFNLPVNAAILRKAFMFTLVLAAIGYTMSIVFFGAIFFSDIIGVAIAGPVFAYLVHLLYMAEK